MASGKLTPRQKMINMMYLVLTALLALNVSKEVLNSFFEVNKGIVKTTNTIEDKSNSKYGALESLNKAKSQPYLDLTDQIKPIADDLNLFIQEMKYDLVYEADGGEVYLCSDPNMYETGNDEDNKQYLYVDKPFSETDKNLKISYLNSKENREASGQLFNPDNKQNGKLFEETGSGRATVLKDKINEYKDLLVNLLRQAEQSGLNFSSSPEKIISEIENTLEIKEGKEYGERGKKVSWEKYNFYDMPAVSALTLLSKWQADIRNIEADVVSFIANSVGAEDLKFTGAKATALPSSNFVLSGDEFSAEIFVTAFNEDLKPEVYVGDYTVSADSTEWISESKNPLEIVNGKGIYKTKTGSQGPKSYKGFIKLPQEDNSNKFYPFSGDYVVAKTSAVVSNDYLRAMFIGEKNKLSVSVPGYNSRDLTVRFDKGSIKGSNGQYVAIPSTGTRSKSEGIVSVYGPNASGKKIKLGSIKFKMYPVPIPEMFVDGAVNGATVSKAKLYNGKGLRYKSTELLEMFEGIKYSIKRFDMYVTSQSGGQEKATKVRTMRQNILSQAVSGDRIAIENIWYEVSGKTRKYPSSLTFTIE